MATESKSPKDETGGVKSYDAPAKVNQGLPVGRIAVIIAAVALIIFLLNFFL